MDAYKIALRDIWMEIPEEVLERVFAPGHEYVHKNRAALEAKVKEKVLDPKVRVDCDLMGAAEVSIPLVNLKPTVYNQFTVSFKIPKTLTQGRRITSVLAVTYGTSGLSNFGATDLLAQYGSTSYSATADAATGIMNAHTAIPDMQNIYASIIGENVISIEGYTPMLTYGYLRCLVAHDEVMSTLKPQSLTWFAELCVYAVKAYIYNNYYIKMDMGELVGGRELQSFRNIVESYSDAAELYREFYRTTWSKVNYLNDPERKYRLLRGMTGGLG